MLPGRAEANVKLVLPPTAHDQDHRHTSPRDMSVLIRQRSHLVRPDRPSLIDLRLEFYIRSDTPPNQPPPKQQTIS